MGPVVWRENPLASFCGCGRRLWQIEGAEKALLGTRGHRQKLPCLQVDEAEVVVKGMKARGPGTRGRGR